MIVNRLITVVGTPKNGGATITSMNVPYCPVRTLNGLISFELTEPFTGTIITSYAKNHALGKLLSSRSYYNKPQLNIIKSSSQVTF